MLIAILLLLVIPWHDMHYMRCRKLLIKDAQGAFISQIPESLRKDLIERLRTFSQEKVQFEGPWPDQVWGDRLFYCTDFPSLPSILIVIYEPKSQWFDNFFFPSNMLQHVLSCKWGLVCILCITNCRRDGGIVSYLLFEVVLAINSRRMWRLSLKSSLRWLCFVMPSRRSMQIRYRRSDFMSCHVFFLHGGSKVLWIVRRACQEFIPFCTIRFRLVLEQNLLSL